MRERFTRGDAGFVVACLLCAIVCGTIAWRGFPRAFPEASIDFQVNRTQSATVAGTFLLGQGHDLGRSKHASIFAYDEDAKIFLERELGLERAQGVYADPVRLWRWDHRWFVPHEKEELRVAITTDGRVVRYEHLLPEDAASASLDAESARRIAEVFAATQAGVDWSAYTFVEGAAAQLPKRTDHTFTWKRHDFDVADGSCRLRLRVGGDHVTLYEEYFDVPQPWQDAYARLRARNQTAGLVASVGLLLTVLALIGVLVLRVRDRDVRWKLALGFGAVGFVLQFLSGLNEFDVAKFGYETQDGYPAFVTGFALQSLLIGLAVGGMILVLTAGGEPMYRQAYPDKISLGGFFSRRGIGTKKFFKETLLGVVLMTFFAAYQTIFYLVAARFGAWAPLEVPYSNVLNTSFPWALVLLIGFLPAVSEEFISRLFSIPFLDGLLRRLRLGRRGALALAVVISAAVWGFAHSDYPNQPFWIRGAEVGGAGVVIGFIMLRWGILATLVWHYTVDAFYTSLLLLRSGNNYFVISGAVAAGIMLVPIAVVLIRSLRRGGFEPEAGLLNGDDVRPAVEMAAASPVAATAAVEPEPVRTRSAPIARRRVILGAAVAAALLLLFLIPTHVPGSGIRVRSTRAEALDAARAHLLARGEDPARYRTLIAMWNRFDPQVGRYALERMDLAGLDSLHTAHVRTPVWRVRFFRPGEKNEFVFNLPVDVSPQGTAPALPLWAFEHVMSDTTAGDTLDTDAARALAAAALRLHGLEPDALELKESKSERRKSRMDHTFEWQVPDPRLGEAEVRYVVMVRGGEVAGLRPYVHLPENWVREDEERSAMQHVARVGGLSVFGVAMILLVVQFVLMVRARRFPWRTAAWWGVAGAVVQLALTELRWGSDLVMRYETNVPYSLFRIGAVVSAGLQSVLVGLVITVAVGTTLALQAEARRLWSSRWAPAWVRDGCVLAAIAVVLGIGMRRAEAVLTRVAGSHADIDGLLMIPSAGTPVPWLDAFLAGLRSALLLLTSFAILAHALASNNNRRRIVLMVTAAAILLAANGARSPAQFLFKLAESTVLGSVLLFAIWGLLRDHVLAYVLAILGARLLAATLGWMQHPALRQQGMVLAVAWLATLAVVILLIRRGAGDSGDQRPMQVQDGREDMIGSGLGGA